MLDIVNNQNTKIFGFTLLGQQINVVDAEFTKTPSHTQILSFVENEGLHNVTGLSSRNRVSASTSFASSSKQSNVDRYNQPIAQINPKIALKLLGSVVSFTFELRIFYNTTQYCLDRFYLSIHFRFFQCTFQKQVEAIQQYYPASNQLFCFQFDCIHNLKTQLHQNCIRNKSFVKTILQRATI